ncbi:phage terminase large subunit family protein [Azoarcus communis]|uniref:terminase gpA endonuclease subunit n=1 Tax=Parazoarcus communis TaxID=41977 RepID=UPI0014594913|nr:phage terminase large subunit family protein [Parazoarcus communis]
MVFHGLADGGLVALHAVQAGLAPDSDLPVDLWADTNMILPQGKSAEPGPYRTARTPFARQIMRCLSPSHPCRRVVVEGPSQLLKTQVAINWVGSIICQAPANMLVLLPTDKIAKRVSARISDAIKLVPEMRARVAAPRSRDSRNTTDTKEFEGGVLYITTAGSASNLAEIPARYVYGDEIDRWESNIDGEGDPVGLAETRTSTFEYNSKVLFTSSPTIEGLSRIDALYAAGTRNRYYIACPHCGTHQTLEWSVEVRGEDGRIGYGGIKWDNDELPTRAWYVCPHCGCEIEEAGKANFLPDREMGGTAEWRAAQVGDGKTESFHLNALYAPLGFVSWLSLARQYLEAKRRLDHGDPEPMQVFVNTRLAKAWDAAVAATKAEELRARAEPYPLGVVPPGGLVLTASVDTQPSRLELEIKAWGEGLENWIVAYRVLWGDPTQDAVWRQLDDILSAPIPNHLGVPLRVAACCIDTGGANTQDVYNFVRHRRQRSILGIKGSSRPNSPVMAARPRKVDVSWRGRAIEGGAELWFVGTDVAKDWIHGRLHLTSGHGACHFSSQLPDDYFDQLVAEKKVIRYVKGHAKAEWVKKPGDRNEALDTFVYNLAGAYYLGLHAKTAAEWDKLRQIVEPVQSDLFMAPPVAHTTATPPEGKASAVPAESADLPARPAPAVVPEPPRSRPSLQLPAPVPVAARPARRATRNAYLSR